VDQVGLLSTRWDTASYRFATPASHAAVPEYSRNLQIRPSRSVKICAQFASTTRPVARTALRMKAEPFAEPNPDQDLAAASDAPGIPEDLLIVGDVGLEDSNGARDQQYDDTQRNENLHYSE
jgi:hypothetical protein